MIWLFLSLFIQAQEYEGKYLSKYTLPIGSGGLVELGEFSKPPKLSYESLKERGFNSYEDFLGYIEKKAPALFDQYVLIHTSGSLQRSTPTHPRVLLYGENLVFALSENPKISDRRVEILDFDVKTSEVTMREIVFTVGKAAQFHDEPKECLSCHGQPARPLWESYDFWPNVFGSRDGIFISNQEKLSFQSIAQVGVYGKLDISEEKNKKSIEVFTVYISQINFLRWFKSLEPSLWGELYPFRYYLLGLFSCDYSFGLSLEDRIRYKEYIPDTLIQKMPVSFSAVFDDVVTAHRLTKNYLDDLYHNIFIGSTVHLSLPLDRLRDGEIPIGSQLEWLFSNYGLYFRDGLMSMRQDNHIMSTPTVYQIELQKVFLRVFPNLIKELDHSLEMVGGTGIRYHQFNCKDLRKKSLESLEATSYNSHSRFVSALAANSQQPIFGKCLSCHVVNRAKEKAPYIAFDQTVLLSQQLKQGLLVKIQDRLNRQDHLRMPKGLPMSDAEKTSLVMSLKLIQNLD